MKKLLPRKKPSLGIVLFVLLAAVTIFVFFAGYENSTKLTQIFALATAISGVVSFLIEMIRGKKLAEAEFIVNLNQIFTSNEQYRKAYTCFENYDFENTPDIECLTNSEISNYLTFFETFYLLIERKILDIGMIDDPFAYRFFLAVHNPCVQERKLVKSPKNFPNIYILERLWMKCREKNGFPIYHEERSLEKMVPEEVYRELVSKR